MRTRFAITHKSPVLGLRILTFTNQGRFHFDDESSAQEALVLHKPGLCRVLGDAVKTLEVREVECWDHGDATRTVLED